VGTNGRGGDHDTAQSRAKKGGAGADDVGVDMTELEELFALPVPSGAVDAS
jgi:hypothetical protein